MHERFDRVHLHLDQIYEDMAEWFTVLARQNEELRETLDQFATELRGARSDLWDVGGLALDGQRLQAWVVELNLNWRKFASRPCTEAKTPVSTSRGWTVARNPWHALCNYGRIGSSWTIFRFRYRRNQASTIGLTMRPTGLLTTAFENSGG